MSSASRYPAAADAAGSTAATVTVDSRTTSMRRKAMRADPSGNDRMAPCVRLGTAFGAPGSRTTEITVRAATLVTSLGTVDPRGSGSTAAGDRLQGATTGRDQAIPARP